MTVVNLGVRVAISVDQHPVYESLAPLTARVWIERCGFEPVVVLVGYEEEWRAKRSSSLVLRELEDLDIRPTFVATPLGYRSANLAQIARMYAFLDPNVLPNDVVITTDVDMWPVDRDWFCRHLPNPGTVTAYYGNFPSRFPMCYVAANKVTWFEMVAPAAYVSERGVVPAWCTIDACARSHLLSQLKPETAAVDAWQHDEEFLTARIHRLGDERITKIIRPPGDPFPDRIDRVHWPVFMTDALINSVKDAHLVRPAHEPSCWTLLEPLLEKLCPSIVGWAKDYIHRYRGTLR